MPRAVTVKPFGNWAGARNMTSTLDKSIKRSIRAAEEKIAKKLIKIVKGHIMNQDLPWEKLTARTVANKKGNSLIYLDKRIYINSISFWQEGYSVNIGIKKGIIHPHSKKKVEVWKIASWMEYGTSKMKERPIWGPSVREMGGRGKGMNSIVKETVERRLAKEGWRVDLPY